MRIPRPLHEVLGETQSPGSIVAVLGVGLVVGGALLVGYAPGLATVAPWRAAVAALLLFDLGAGVVANFTRGTNAFYAARPRMRLVFIAIHVHPLVVALLLSRPLGALAAAWGYTVLAAFAVNALAGRASQTPVAGALLAAGVAGVALLPGLTPPDLALAAIFLLKVPFAFAVDHYR